MMGEMKERMQESVLDPLVKAKRSLRDVGASLQKDRDKLERDLAKYVARS